MYDLSKCLESRFSPQSFCAYCKISSVKAGNAFDSPMQIQLPASAKAFHSSAIGTEDAPAKQKLGKQTMLYFQDRHIEICTALDFSLKMYSSWTFIPVSMPMSLMPSKWRQMLWVQSCGSLCPRLKYVVFHCGIEVMKS